MPAARSRASKVTRMAAIFPFSVWVQFAVGHGGATVVCRSNHVRAS